MIFRGDENLKKLFYCNNVNVYRYSKLIKEQTFRTNSCLVINLNQKRFEIK